MAIIDRNCDYCQNRYKVNEQDLNRGWGLSCSKSCAAFLRELKKSDTKSFNERKGERIPSSIINQFEVIQKQRKLKSTGAKLYNRKSFSSLSEVHKSRINKIRYNRIAPQVEGYSGIISGISEEGYTIMDGFEWDFNGKIIRKIN